MRLFAFLRAINVGGHTVTMAALRKVFESMGLRDVETFIASGNVIFERPAGSLAGLADRIEGRLQASLGYEVKTFLRTEAEVAAIARYKPFPEKSLLCAGAFCVAFLAEPLTAGARKALASLKNENDDFRVNGREAYWLCRSRQGESDFSNAVFEKTLKVRATFRGMNTVARLAARYANEHPKSV